MIEGTEEDLDFLETDNFISFPKVNAKKPKI